MPFQGGGSFRQWLTTSVGHRLATGNDLSKTNFESNKLIISGDLLCTLFTILHSVQQFVHYLYTIEAVHYWTCCWIKGKKLKVYRFKTSQQSIKKTLPNGQPCPGLKTTSSQARRCARHETGNQVNIKEGNFCSVAPNEWLVRYINSWSYERLLSLTLLSSSVEELITSGETPSMKLRRNSQLLLLS